MKNNPTPPYFTTSCSLLLSTIFVFVLVFYAYFFWYQKDFSFFRAHQIEKTRIIVKPSDNLTALLQSINNFTILSLSPGKYSGNFRLSNKEGIEILGSEETILEAPHGIVLTLEDCLACKIAQLSIQGEDEKNPSLFLLHSQNIMMENMTLKNPAQALKIQTQSQKIVVLNARVLGTIKIENSSFFTLQESEIETFAPVPCISIEKAMKIELHKNKIQAKEGILLKDIFSDDNSQNTITQTTISTSGTCLFMSDCRDFLMTWNDMTSQEATAVSLLKCHGIIFGKSDFRNKVKTQKGHALWIAGSKNISIEDSWFKNQDTEKNAVYGESSSHIQFQKNQISGLALYEEGILKDLRGGGLTLSSTLQTRLENNTVQESQIGIRLEKGCQGILSHNKIGNNGGNGIEIDNSEIIVGPSNIVSQNYTGILLKNAKGEISENTIYENKEDGMLLENTSVKIQKNQISKNSANGIRLKNNSSPTLFQNQILQNKGFGISFLQPGTVSWKAENTFDANIKGPTDRMDTQ